jgi:hypothetical protein
MTLIRNKVGNPKFRNGELGMLARDFLIGVINNGMITERDVVKLSPRYTRTAVLNQYHRLVAMGFNIKRRAISLPRRHQIKFRRGVIPSEVVYYI